MMSIKYSRPEWHLDLFRIMDTFYFIKEKLRLFDELKKAQEKSKIYDYDYSLVDKIDSIKAKINDYEALKEIPI